MRVQRALMGNALATSQGEQAGEALGSGGCEPRPFYCFSLQPPLIAPIKHWVIPP